MDIILMFLIYDIYVIISMILLWMAVYVKKLRKLALVIGVFSIGSYMLYINIGGKDVLKTIKRLYNDQSDVRRK